MIYLYYYPNLDMVICIDVSFSYLVVESYLNTTVLLAPQSKVSECCVLRCCVQTSGVTPYNQVWLVNDCAESLYTRIFFSNNVQLDKPWLEQCVRCQPMLQKCAHFTSKFIVEITQKYVAFKSPLAEKIIYAMRERTCLFDTIQESL